MKVLIIFAHPEPLSLNGSLHQLACDELKQQGHDVQTSDLYRMRWKSQVDRDDFIDLPAADRLHVVKASGSSYASGSLSEDIKMEQNKLLWADTVIFQFPLWWFSVPAILKGWIERVYTYGFAYGVDGQSDKRYGEGRFKGKRAMLFVTIGGQESHYSARGINGPIDDVLYPLNHGVLFYPGFEVLPPLVVYRADRTDEAEFEILAIKVRERMRSLHTIAPIPYRIQNGGDYRTPEMTLRDGLEHKNVTGFAMHCINIDRE